MKEIVKRLEKAIELEKFTGVSLEYAQEQELIDAIKRVRK